MTGAIIDEGGPEALLAWLRGAGRERIDVPTLRAALVDMEGRYGVVEAHRFATELLRAEGAVLRHPEEHLRGLTASVLSPCGRHLAVGSQVGDDYDRGGALQVWEVATGRCVNMFTGIRMGVGFDRYPRTVQWSADGTGIAAVHGISAVGRWDPFGVDPRPSAVAGINNGASRPPAFGLSPGGDRALLAARAPDGHDVHVGIFPMDRESFWYGEWNGSEVPEWPAVAFPAEVRERLGDEVVFADHLSWSRDGARAHCRGGGWMFSVDLRRREVAWIAAAGGSPGSGNGPMWSVDERWVAAQSHGRLLFRDALTGETVADVPGHPEQARLVWGQRGAVRRLAVLVPNERFDRNGGHVHDGAHHVAVYDDGVHRYDLPTRVGRAHADDYDAIAWAWAPDGRHAAVVTDDGDIEVWSLDDRPAKVLTANGAEGTYGVLWAAGDMLVLVGETTLRFVRAFTGEVVGDFAFLREPPATRPVDIATGTGSAVVKALGYDPTFAVEDRWAAAFGTGVVIDPAVDPDALDRMLAWAVDRRYAWPARWGGLTVVPTLARAVAHVPEIGGVGAAEPGDTDGPGPPPNPSTVDDLLDVVRTTLHTYSDTLYAERLHSPFIDDSFRLTARLFAYRGAVDTAFDLIGEIADPSTRYRAVAEVALIAGAEHGLVDAARQRFQFSDETIELDLKIHEVAGVGAAVGGACAVFGDTARADAWFARAKAAIEPETNGWQNRLAVIWSLIVCGRTDEARELWTATVPKDPSRFAAVPMMAFLARTGRHDIARELRVQPGFERIDNIGITTVPDHETTPAETADLAAAHAELMRMPRSARRHETEHLISRAARYGHIGAVVSLLASVPDDGRRAQAAVRALWTVTTGTDTEPW